MESPRMVQDAYTTGQIVTALLSQVDNAVQKQGNSEGEGEITLVFQGWGQARSMRLERADGAGRTRSRSALGHPQCGLDSREGTYASCPRVGRSCGKA